MALLVGAFLALGVGRFATFIGLDRDRAFYPTVMIVIASYYVLFAVMGAPVHTIVVESLCGAIFVIGAVSGFRSSLWIVVAALALHGAFDFLHAELYANPGVPSWWPSFCLAFDFAAAAYLAALLKSGSIPRRRTLSL